MRTLPVLLVAALLLSGCGGTTTPAASSNGTTTTTAQGTATAQGTTDAPTPADAPLTVESPWVKATTHTMTGVFAILKNPGQTPVKVLSAASPMAGRTELHVTVKDASGAMVMKKTEAGFTVPAGGTFELRPGSNHVMLMGLTEKVLSGVSVPVTLTLDGGRTMTFQAQGREYSGAKETYAPTATVPPVTPDPKHTMTATAPGTPADSMSSSH